MQLQIKNFTKIIFATLAGGGVVLLSLSGTKIFESRISFENNQPDNNRWLNTLSVLPSSSPTAPLGTNYAQSGTTTTAFIAHEFITNYTRAQANKGSAPLDDSDVQSLVQTLSEKARATAIVKQYSEKDIITVPAGTSTIAIYKKEIIEALNTFAQKNKTNEFTFVAQALDNNDASKLAPIANNITNYQALVDSLLVIHVPRTALAFHLSLIQGYSNMLAGVVDMKETIVDPARGLQGVTKYNNGATLVGTAISMLRAQ